MPRIAGKPLILIAAVSLELSIAGPLSAFCTPQTSSHDPQVTAEVIPTQDEVETLLARLGERVHDAELATVISPTVEREFVDAKIALRSGDYLGALDHAGAADRALSNHPRHHIGNRIAR
jgi:hypothetical protein